TQDTPGKKRWAKAVCDNAVQLSSELGHRAAGRHTIKIWRVDDNVVLEKLVLSTETLPPTYLGPRTSIG
ncbi:hypothetical protein G6O44_26380, partial [Salmonella enterica subsp. enterica serovar Enteritidis]|nr:hypothetical protein [Salmonella enterica subsp. enterica serovar Enteritidis]